MSNMPCSINMLKKLQMTMYDNTNAWGRSIFKPRTYCHIQVLAPSLVSHYFYHPVTFHDMPTPGTDRLTPARERINFGDVDF